MWCSCVTPTISLRQFQSAQRGSGGRGGAGSSKCRSACRPGRSVLCTAGPADNGSLQAACQSHELVRVLAVTDLHVDYEENMRWCEAVDGEAHRRDVLVVSGDISDELAALEAALGTLASKFGAVFYCPGNHELWVRERDRACGIYDSLTKLRHIQAICCRLGVHTQPRQLGPLWVAPLFSWHHRSWDSEPDIPGVPPVSSWTVADYSACQWPQSVPGGDTPGSLELAQWVDEMNDTPAWRRLLAGREGCDVISTSHFLPYQALLPEKRYLFYPHLTKAVGSAPLAARIQQLQPDIHLFGHTHFAWDQRLGGTRFLQAPLCSPLERQKRLFTVGFGSSMDQAKADPEGAPWLPLVVYQGLVPAGALEAVQAEAAAEAAAAAAQAVAAAAENGGPPAAAVGSAGSAAAPAQAIQGEIQPERPPPGGGGGSEIIWQQAQQQPQQEQQAEQMHGSAPQQPREEQRQQEGAGQGQGRRQLAHLLRKLMAQGWRPLRWGAEAPPLEAHWSTYYETHARKPEIVALAPWVASRWTRRRARAKARASGQSSSGSSGSSSEPEDTE